MECVDTHFHIRPLIRHYFRFHYLVPLSLIFSFFSEWEKAMECIRTPKKDREAMNHLHQLH